VGTHYQGVLRLGSLHQEGDDRQATTVVETAGGVQAEALEGSRQRAAGFLGRFRARIRSRPFPRRRVEKVRRRISRGVNAAVQAGSQLSPPAWSGLSVAGHGLGEGRAPPDWLDARSGSCFRERTLYGSAAATAGNRREQKRSSILLA